MDDLARDQAMIHALVDHTGLTPAAIAKRIGSAVTTIQRPHKGTAPSRLGIRTLEKLRDRFPDFPGWQDYFDAETALETTATLAIPMIDLNYGMGGTYLDDIEIEETVEKFPLSFIRAFTRAPADKLYFAGGIGDSMMPTIHDRDLLLIDRSQEKLTMNDQVWALTIGGIGMIKRLRVEGDGRVRILSDNASVPDQDAADDEIKLIGRVVGKFGRM